ncbi:MAG: type II toxin-antitoxin system RelE/ParE family toxin [Gammaproteobacteria bacterium]|nr:type II toxin-antitoxin system RelE/ParE family toxin [Gammaproteobacteria bacterium]
MPFVLKRPMALADLVEIWDFIADDSEANADNFLSKLESRLDLLAHQPRMGRARDELMNGLRSYPIGRYVVFYLPHPDGVELVRVLHSARDIDADTLNPAA